MFWFSVGHFLHRFGNAIFVTFVILMGLFFVKVFVTSEPVENAINNSKETVRDYFDKKTYALFFQKNREDVINNKNVANLESLDECAAKARDIAEDNNDFDMRLGLYTCYTISLDQEAKQPTGTIKARHRVTIREGKLYIRDVSEN